MGERLIGEDGNKGSGNCMGGMVMLKRGSKWEDKQIREKVMGGTERGSIRHGRKIGRRVSIKNGRQINK